MSNTNQSKDFCRFPDCKCPMDPGPAPDWCAIGLPHARASANQSKEEGSFSGGGLHAASKRELEALIASYVRCSDGLSPLAAATAMRAIHDFVNAAQNKAYAEGRKDEAEQRSQA